MTIGGRSMIELGGELIEEIGELLAMSAILTFVFGLVPARLALRVGAEASSPKDGAAWQGERRLAATQFHSD
jgi:hypothetical protein